MTRQQIIDTLSKYRRPGSPLYQHHFRRLPSEIVDGENVPVLLDVLRDASLPAKVREHAAGALGEIGDEDAVPALLEALQEPPLQRGVAVALGRMRAKEATDSLATLAPRLEAAAWALSQLGVTATTLDLIEDLRSGHLRLIGPKVANLDPAQAQAVAEAIRQRLEQTLAQGSLTPDDRWMITALQFLAPPQAADLLTEALEHCVQDRTCCDCLRNRLMRALGAIRPPQAIPALVQVICRIPNPIQKQLAVVCIEKIITADEEGAMALLRQRARRLRREVLRLQGQLSTTKPVIPDRPWHYVPGSPGWRAATERAIKAITRLAARL
jgi:HEAT repeat protein